MDRANNILVVMVFTESRNVMTEHRYISVSREKKIMRLGMSDNKKY